MPAYTEGSRFSLIVLKNYLNFLNFETIIEKAYVLVKCQI